MSTRNVWMTVALCCLASSAGGEWPTDPMVNVPLCNAAGYQGGNGLAAVPSIDGGVIVAWQDDRDGDNDIYAQRVNFGGDIQWPIDGVPVCMAADTQSWLQGISDGTGGAILVWTDGRNNPTTSFDIYAQRISGSGTTLWGAGDAPVCVADGAQDNPAIAPDGSGGAFVAWDHNATGGDVLVWADSRNLATGVDIYAQGVFLITVFVDGFESGDTDAWDAQH